MRQRTYRITTEIAAHALMKTTVLVVLFPGPDDYRGHEDHCEEDADPGDSSHDALLPAADSRRTSPHRVFARTLRALRARSGNPEAVAVRVLDIALTAGEPVLVNRDSEYGRDQVDVAHIQVNESVRSRVTGVL